MAILGLNNDVITSFTYKINGLFIYNIRGSGLMSRNLNNITIFLQRISVENQNVENVKDYLLPL